jgi:hypothetical protein
LLGWLLHLTRRSKQPWIAVDLEAFAKVAGVSIRTAKRALARLRDKEGGLKFRTIWHHKDGRKGHWQVLAADPAKLKYDREPLFETENGRPRHVRLTLRSECHAIYRAVSKGYQQVVNGPRPLRNGISPKGSARLRRKTGAIVDRLERLHWDNCKVQFDRGTAWNFVFESIRAGHSEKRILNAYDIALHRLHGTATDLGQTFALSSTVARARKWLDAQDSLSPAERISEFYQSRRQDTAALFASLRANLARATLGNPEPA